ncbi:Lrp/AsnC family transcriptional regulator [Allorhizobium taibaishanense]|uniref:AsnC family transcriptional regulator n=1 Tax=Allorhizobium taibaishanense TaxID=887144 RepID=A0A1Q9A3G1_9HYPH|nr:Lrp/AsnC family transcriptional regulator [Allorhizobium taibaishanense]MBB4006125.1 DNA-binding Lrp family transcriptional regulator [Allorhizobium taibaishanense]OLP49124.1 AsnC family transcriptional regulator [Allorhizobium taibaishanense]
MDQLDRKIIRALERDARISYAALSEEVSLSKSPCWARVKAMEEQGVIRGYRTELDPARLGFGLEAFVQVSIDFEQSEAFEAAVRNHPLIRRCHATTGEADYLLHILARDMSGMDKLLREEICRLPGVKRSITAMVTREIKAETALAVAAQAIGS